jgi:predicted HicB family RNase H-like nuclease
MKARDKYLKIVEWSKADDCYIGSIPGFLGPCCHGDNEEVVYKQLGKILDEWIEIHEHDELPFPEETADKSYSGKFILRVNKELHKLLSIKALQSNLSLNQLCENLLKSSVLKKKTA